MAEFEIAVKENVGGRFFVDDTCIYCDLCRVVAPTIFAEHKSGWAYVKRQPDNEEEIRLVYEALEACPTESIGDIEYPSIEQVPCEKKRKWWKFRK